MSKRDDFLYAVQTAIITNSINLICREKARETYATAEHAIVSMREILLFADRIPDELTAAEAAKQFCYYYFKNLRENEEAVTKREMECPRWCSLP